MQEVTRQLVVGSGLGGRTALGLIPTPRPTFLRRLALIDTLPGTAESGQEADAGTERFRSGAEAVRDAAGEIGIIQFAKADRCH